MNSSGITKENLLFSFPVALRENDAIAALGDVTADAIARRPAEISRLSIYPRIDELPEDLLDILAYDFKVDWYDYEYPIEIKRALIKGNILAHKRQGTVYATRLVLNSLYPKSELEEWFTYDGRPGCFRLNVNVSNSAAEGAVEVYSTEEILRRIATVKRLSAHLDSVSYMVRNAIVVKHRIDSWLYRLPFCGPTRCGTWWTRKMLGWSERRSLSVGGRADVFNISPEISGTLPYIKTPGYSLRTGLRISGRADAYPHQPQFAGVIRSGTEWLRKTLGWSEQTGPLALSGRADAYGVAPELSGTLPEVSRLGYTFACGALRAGGVIDIFKDSPKEAGEPERTGTWPETAKLGHSITGGAVQVGGGTETFQIAPELAGTLPEDSTAGHSVTIRTVRTGGGAETFKATPELTGTLPEDAARGYTIAGELSTEPKAEGFKTEPEFTGTLPKEAQNGDS